MALGLVAIVGLGISLAISPLSAGTIVYTHDAAGRLTGASSSDGKFIGYTYDNAGNLLLRQFAVIGVGDSDNDGMDDAWEFDYFQTLARDGTDDFDLDGASDLAEFLAGTEPTDPDSALKFLPNPIVSSNSVIVQWVAVSGKTYRLQFKNSLGDPAWQDIPGDVTASGSIASKLDIMSGGLKERFYRVRLLP